MIFCSPVVVTRRKPLGFKEDLGGSSYFNMKYHFLCDLETEVFERKLHISMFIKCLPKLGQPDKFLTLSFQSLSVRF